VKRVSILAFILIGIAAAAALVILVAPNASSKPDGLEKVAADTGIDSEVSGHALANGPLAEYGVDGVDNRYVGTWVAGLTGVGVTFAIGAGLVFAVRQARRSSGSAPPVAT
jgi:PDGLE domain